MPTQAKRATVDELNAAFSRSTAAIVADYRGLRVSDITQVRRSLRDRGIEYRVVKNRLARIAADEAGLAELAPLLQGPSGIALGSGDETSLARDFLEAVRPYRTVAVRGALLRGKRIDGDGVTRLAALPPRDVLLAQLVGGVASPLSTMASLLSGPLRNLGYALQGLRDQRAGTEAATEAAPEGA